MATASDSDPSNRDIELPLHGHRSLHCLHASLHSELEDNVGERSGTFSDLATFWSHTFLLCCLVSKSCPTYLVHGISQAKILEWVAISCSRESS